MNKKTFARTILIAVGLLFAMSCSLLSGGGIPAAEGEPPQSDGANPSQGAPAAPTQAVSPAQPASGGETGGCGNPYYPVVQGAAHSYNGDSELGGPFSFTTTISQVQADGFTLTSQYPNLTVTQKWACRPEGLAALQYGGGVAADLSASGTSAQFETTQSNGLTLPASIAPGDEWNQSFSIQGTQSMPGGETATTEGTVEYTFKALGVESVTVPAGTFQAMKIQVETNFDLKATFQGLSVPVAYGSTGASWYAADVGWVKTSESGVLFDQPFSASIELTSYNLP